MQSLVPESDRTHEFFVVHEIGMDGEPNRRPAVVVMIKAAEPFDEARNQRFLGRSVKKRFVPSDSEERCAAYSSTSAACSARLLLKWYMQAPLLMPALVAARSIVSAPIPSSMMIFRRIEDGLSGFYCFITGHLGKKCTEENP